MYNRGYTTGVFDLFHIGHLKILQKAKKLSKKLIVGVSSDEVVYSYKGRYPIIPFEERLEIVSSIDFVDEAIVQNTMNKIDAWEKVKYDALFHGDDWKGSEMYEEIKKKLVPKGVDLVFFEHTPHTSTSALKKKIYEEELLNLNSKKV